MSNRHGDVAREHRDQTLDHDWRTYSRIVYDDQVRGSSWQPGPTTAPAYAARVAADRDRRDHLLDTLSRDTGVHPDILRGEATNAAWAYGRDSGAEGDPDRFAPPDWDALRDRTAAKRQALDDAAQRLADLAAVRAQGAIQNAGLPLPGRDRDEGRER